MALDIAELRELHRTVYHLDIGADAFAFIAAAVLALALETWKSRLLAVLHTAEEVLVGGIQVTQGTIAAQ